MENIARKRGSLWFAVLTAICVCSGGAAAGEGGVEDGPFRVRMRDNEVAYALKRVLRGADQRLDDPVCREVMTDFRDASARTLEEALAAHGVSARTYLRWVLFAEDQGSKACKTSGTVAATEPGSRVVFICPRSFLEMARTDPEDAEATMIHEMLHSLGLGENPPRSREITERVLSRCASSHAR